MWTPSKLLERSPKRKLETGSSANKFTAPVAAVHAGRLLKIRRLPVWGFGFAPKRKGLPEVDSRAPK